MPHLPGAGNNPGLKWNYANRLEQTYASSSAVARYSYDGGGNRVVKRYGSLSGYTLTPSKITVYLPGGFEISQSLSGGSVWVEWQTLAVMDDRGCLARFEVKTIEAGASTGAAAVLRYQLGNHLGSSCLETTDSGQVLTREEYYPYGGTAYAFAASGYSGFSVKRYRYAGKECDSENGLYYFGARYFAAWLGRWTAGDPVFQAGRSGYEFCSGNPVSRVDPDGRDPALPDAVYQSLRAQLSGAGASGHSDAQPRTRTFHSSPTPSQIDFVGPPNPNEFMVGPAGVRLQANWPRDHYANMVAGNEARAGNLRLAEVAEAGHGCSYCHIVKDSPDHRAADAQLDLVRYGRMASRMMLGREASTFMASVGPFGSVPKVEFLDPKVLRWSQSSAGGSGRAGIIRRFMSEKGWIGPPADVVATVDGLVTVDHTRAAVALEQNMREIPVVIRQPGDPLPAEMLSRPWNKAGDTVSTWGEAIQLRGSSQTPRIGPTGRPIPPRLP